jgi:hypothetical protein
MIINTHLRKGKVSTARSYSGFTRPFCLAKKCFYCATRRYCIITISTFKINETWFKSDLHVYNDDVGISYKESLEKRMLSPLIYCNYTIFVTEVSKMFIIKLILLWERNVVCYLQGSRLFLSNNFLSNNYTLVPK